MYDEHKIDTNKLEWTVFLFNIMGEGKSYFVDLYKVKVTDKKEPGYALLHFLDNWGMRLATKPKKETDTDYKKEINDWYNEEPKILTSLENKNIIDVNLKNEKASITELYKSLCVKKGIKDTAASKILHMIIPNLFVMWDNPIRLHYIKDYNKKEGPEAYILFLKEMQRIANQLKNSNINCDYLFSKIKDPMEKNLENFLSKKGMKEDKEKIIKFAEQNGKTIPKFIDEYNWIVYTKEIQLPPSWHP